MEEIVVCSGLTKEYKSFPALIGVSLSLYGGRSAMLTGDSGSGKSIFLKLIAGLVKPTDGEVLVLGQPPSYRTRAETAYLPDRDHLPKKLTPSQLLRCMSGYFDDLDGGMALRLFAECGIDTFKCLGGMSKGQRAAVRLILTLSRKARLYLLDEPFSELDDETSKILSEVISERTSQGVCIAAAARSSAKLPFEPDDLLTLRSGTVLDYRPAKGVWQ